MRRLKWDSKLTNNPIFAWIPHLKLAKISSILREDLNYLLPIHKMEYVFKNTEQNQEKASTHETKSLLYLLWKNKGKERVEYLVVDCFNDVSGIDSDFSKIWDLQSKNHKTLNPKKIWESLYTLFSNYTSKLPICELILFVPPLEDKYKIDSKAVVYGASNLKAKELNKIENWLREEATRRKHVYSDENIETFFAKVTITEDRGSESDYVKKVTKFKDKDFKTDDFYTSIFKELRDIQSAKKNTCIENQKISEIKDVLVFRKHFMSKDIEVLIMNRVVGCELFSFKSIPRKFLPIINGMSQSEVDDILDECNANLSRAFFNKSDNRTFWKVCEKIISHISWKWEYEVNDVFDVVFLDDKRRPRYLDDKTIQYLIAIILDQ